MGVGKEVRIVEATHWETATSGVKARPNTCCLGYSTSLHLRPCICDSVYSEAVTQI